MYSNSVPTFDSHIHIYTENCLDWFDRYIKDNNLTGLNVACLCNLNEAMADNATQNILAAIYKLKNPNVFAHAGLVYPRFPVPDEITGEYDFAFQANELIDMGFDGIKMLESKPTVRKMTKMPVDTELLDGFYSYAEKNKIHIISHVADPETFWDKDKAPEFSFSEGWFYGDGTFETKEHLYDEVMSVLEKFPKLKITFAHFFFLSDFPEKAKEILDRYPNVYFDLTPGREMYDNFTRHYDVNKEFFSERYDRLIFGTDMTSSEFQGSSGELISAVKRFLCTEDNFRFWDFDIHGVGLEEAKSEMILGGNFFKRVSDAPKPIDKKALAGYIEKRIYGIKSDSARRYILDFAEKNL